MFSFDAIMIDTHCHLNDSAYTEDLDDVINRAKKAGISKILIPGTEEADLDDMLRICRQYKGFTYPAIGLHPENINDNYKKQLDILHYIFEQYNDWIAIGEIGLDYHFDKTFVNQQQDALQVQLEWARETQLPVMIHSRDATADMQSILIEAAKWGNQGVLHCFSGSYETASRYLDYGWKLGIGGVLTFKNSKLSEVLAKLPLTSLVLETDGPYLAPTPHRGERNESSYIPLIVEKLAQIYNTTPQEVEQITDCTAKELFRIE